MIRESQLFINIIFRRKRNVEEGKSGREGNQGV